MSQNISIEPSLFFFKNSKYKLPNELLVEILSYLPLHLAIELIDYPEISNLALYSIKSSSRLKKLPIFVGRSANYLSQCSILKSLNNSNLPHEKDQNQNQKLKIVYRKAQVDYDQITDIKFLNYPNTDIIENYSQKLDLRVIHIQNATSLRFSTYFDFNPEKILCHLNLASRNFNSYIQPSKTKILLEARWLNRYPFDDLDGWNLFSHSENFSCSINVRLNSCNKNKSDKILFSSTVQPGYKAKIIENDQFEWYRPEKLELVIDLEKLLEFGNNFTVECVYEDPENDFIEFWKSDADFAAVDLIVTMLD